MYIQTNAAAINNTEMHTECQQFQEITFASYLTLSIHT